jgi:hypothetical protein
LIQCPRRSGSKSSSSDLVVPKKKPKSCWPELSIPQIMSVPNYSSKIIGFVSGIFIWKLAREIRRSRIIMYWTMCLCVYVAPGRLLGYTHDGTPGLFDLINDDGDVTFFEIQEGAEVDVSYGHVFLGPPHNTNRVS